MGQLSVFATAAIRRSLSYRSIPHSSSMCSAVGLPFPHGQSGASMILNLCFIETPRTIMSLYMQIFSCCNVQFCFISHRASPTKICAKLVIAGIWVISAALAAPMAYALRVTDIEYTTGHFKPFCYNTELSDNAMLSYRVVLLVLQYVIPLCVISCVYIRMALTLWGSKTPGNAQSTRDATLMKNKKKVSS